MSKVCAEAFCPFISAASPKFLGLNSWIDLGNLDDLNGMADGGEFREWNAFRHSSGSRFVVLTMPRALARLQYGMNTKPIEDFCFEEFAIGSHEISPGVDVRNYCWMNMAYVLGTRLADSFAKYGWCSSIVGREDGGCVEGLPSYATGVPDDDFGVERFTECAISIDREQEIADCGFLPLCQDKNTAVFFEGRTTHCPNRNETEEDEDMTADAIIASRLQCIMATSRIVHYLMVMSRDKMAALEIADLEKYLNNWVLRFVDESLTASAEDRIRRPFCEARLEVKPSSSSPGKVDLVTWLRPWLPTAKLSQPTKIVIGVPSLSR